MCDLYFSVHSLLPLQGCAATTSLPFQLKLNLGVQVPPDVAIPFLGIPQKFQSKSSNF